LFYSILSVTGYFNDKYFGGINSFTPEQFQSVNGFSNSYFNWGVEGTFFIIKYFLIKISILQF